MPRRFCFLLLLPLLALTGCEEMPSGPVMLPDGSKVENGLVEFGAEWCGPCQQMKPILEELESGGLAVHAIDVDQQPDFATEYKVSSIPMMLIIREGQVVDKLVGSLSRDQLKARLAKHGL